MKELFIFIIFAAGPNSMNPRNIFKISNASEFSATALNIFQFQYQNNKVYRQFCTLLGKKPGPSLLLEEIPFLPIDFFRTKQVITGHQEPAITFSSSGTTNASVSHHHVQDISLYEKSFHKGFKTFYGPIEDYCILALLPSYLEREGSSLIYMVQQLIRDSRHPDSGFYLKDQEALAEKLIRLDAAGQKTLLIGVSFALLDMAERFPLHLHHTIIMETGGMKGRRKEMIRAELHQHLKKGFGVAHIHSEYGMTELLSQAYSQENGIFFTPPWMKILVRDTEDPLSMQPVGKSGGINIIDLANCYSCSFIATQDLGKIHEGGGFEVLGRYDHADIRGCNLMVL